MSWAGTWRWTIVATQRPAGGVRGRVKRGADALLSRRHSSALNLLSMELSIQQPQHNQARPLPSGPESNQNTDKQTL